MQTLPHLDTDLNLFLHVVDVKAITHWHSANWGVWPLCRIHPSFRHTHKPRQPHVNKTPSHRVFSRTFAHMSSSCTAWLKVLQRVSLKNMFIHVSDCALSLHQLTSFFSFECLYNFSHVFTFSDLVIIFHVIETAEYYIPCAHAEWGVLHRGDTQPSNTTHQPRPTHTNSHTSRGPTHTNSHTSGGTTHTNSHTSGGPTHTNSHTSGGTTRKKKHAQAEAPHGKKSTHKQRPHTKKKKKHTQAEAPKKERRKHKAEAEKNMKKYHLCFRLPIISLWETLKRKLTQKSPWTSWRWLTTMVICLAAKRSKQTTRLWKCEFLDHCEVDNPESCSEGCRWAERDKLDLFKEFKTARKCETQWWMVEHGVEEPPLQFEGEWGCCLDNQWVCVTGHWEKAQECVEWLEALEKSTHTEIRDVVCTFYVRSSEWCNARHVLHACTDRDV